MGVPFDVWREGGAHTGRCSHERVEKPSQRDIRDVIVVVGSTLGIGLAKSGRTFTRMRMCISASVLRHCRGIFGIVGGALAQ